MLTSCQGHPIGGIRGCRSEASSIPEPGKSMAVFFVKSPHHLFGALLFPRNVSVLFHAVVNKWEIFIPKAWRLADSPTRRLQVFLRVCFVKAVAGGPSLELTTRECLSSSG